ncbi:hypothetical protein [Streptomyces subrutilus]|uniref:Uncharacterized protein n=1 Tax=Streptomyces subrutilus TaxID=36818 RepID=A0A5P2UEZ7_9ACTN|nr:hypothetical protein [Streptomyces subrutilus]QEU77029.1 hypothetical protein CP968_00695 [Streptomyces subrutilus]
MSWTPAAHRAPASPGPGTRARARPAHAGRLLRTALTAGRALRPDEDIGWPRARAEARAGGGDCVRA